MALCFWTQQAQRSDTNTSWGSGVDFVMGYVGPHRRFRDPAGSSWCFWGAPRLASGCLFVLPGASGAAPWEFPYASASSWVFAVATHPFNSPWPRLGLKPWPLPLPALCVRCAQEGRLLGVVGYHSSTSVAMAKRATPAAAPACMRTCTWRVGGIEVRGGGGRNSAPHPWPLQL